MALRQIPLTLALLLNPGTVHHPSGCPPGPSVHGATISGPHSICCPYNKEEKNYQFFLCLVGSFTELGEAAGPGR